MPSTRDIRNRIKSLKGTQQITKAMKMVAAAKVKRAQERVMATRPYAQKLKEIFQFVADKMADEDLNEPLLEHREVKNVGLLIVTADKGLCGGYNSNMFRFALQQMQEISAAGQTPKAWLVGNKAISFFRRGEFEILGRYSQLPAVPTYTEAEMLMEAVTSAFVEQKVDKVVLLYTHFVSMLQYQPTALELLPVVPPEDLPPVKGEYLYEPDPLTLLQSILPRYVGRQIYRALLESSASELAARMTAMDSATKNADDLLADLTLLYNKVRQAYITKEILEVVGGAEALSK
ncbi:F0F1 ATP synthase subunit gamma [bacterium (Candidatus Blackallbacteria) CG17_big_fil_post_rev_8_21_14_2_50_48_46]|uniref:ATP synthase gamma chain n=1 Tax=bacterium (Candidatus Blackallbacteria) CG17_big_fil_post_rev_8_21_14_2_50_48_46 TaxID=2014261 RepID=A0A2M7G335_9BACT|nr:MAG: F0F1 ATP synthase subunit gamma [bacterium (Candidatus Blackallbacteria) CG18_big_fil_WC_8_21_14_2_50_49_26]PIW16219.1 MAG: F0F1 ATP synthase subunit gamma [bacterium (Candidatus Blackallbacteria) CG17_big_fil_post_rev_8_21_14_2_50_48_46]PIW49898.1 MAG: F0F1 ATP synthase subunit gamma [bacterium (Candidatus Blackallbacteria) CG13_big_fil_rev_8_21_14_2_50_49_14]